MITFSRAARVAAALAVLVVLALVATNQRRAGRTSEATMMSPAPFADHAETRPMMAVAGKSAVPSRTPPPSAVIVSAVRTSQQAAPGMVIRNGDVSVQVDSIEVAVEAVRRLAAAVGGYIGNVSTHAGERQVRSATLELKVPAARFDDAMSGMAPLGEVERSSALTEDVGEEFVDISARVANAKRLEARLLALLAQRTGKLEDVLAVERELARVREEIERYEGRLRYLSSRVATSTIVATVHEKAPIIAGQPGTNVLANAFVNMWRNFVGVIAGGIELLGGVLPVLAIAWMAYGVFRRWRRPRPPVAAV